jgi:hypothetical protein
VFLGGLGTYIWSFFAGEKAPAVEAQTAKA